MEKFPVIRQAKGCGRLPVANHLDRRCLRVLLRPSFARARIRPAAKRTESAIAGKADASRTGASLDPKLTARSNLAPFSAGDFGPMLSEESAAASAAARSKSAAPRGSFATIALFGGTRFLSALLLFSVQPPPAPFTSSRSSSIPHGVRNVAMVSDDSVHKGIWAAACTQAAPAKCGGAFIPLRRIFADQRLAVAEDQSTA